MTRIVLLLTLCLATLVTWGNPAVANPCARQVLDFLNHTANEHAIDPSAGELGAVDQELRRVIVSNPEEFDLIWRQVSKSDLLEIAEGVRSGALKATPRQRTRLEALVNFVKNDPYNTLWSGEAGGLQAMQTRYPQWRAASSEAGLGGTIAGVDTYAMTEIEKEIVAAGLGRQSRIGRSNAAQRAWSPAYSHVKRILSFNNDLRRRFDRIEEVQNAILAADGEASKLSLSREERAALANSMDHMREIRGLAKKQSETAYGQDIFTGGIQAHPELDIYKISKRITQLEKPEDAASTNSVLASERAMDAIDESLNSGRARQGLPPRKPSDYFDPELKIRNEQYGREVDHAVAERSGVMDEDTGLTVTVSYKWEETEYYTTTESYTDSNGRIQTRTVTKSRTVTKHGTKTINLSYNQLISKRLELVGDSTPSPGSNGRITSVHDPEPLLRQTAGVAREENSMANALSNVYGKLGEFMENHVSRLAQSTSAQREVFLKELAQIRTEFAQIKSHAEQYAQWKDAKVREQWGNDDPKNFRARNKELAGGIGRTLDLLDVYSEQFKRRQMELRVAPALPDYQKELRTLAVRAGVNYTVKGAASMLGACAAWDGVHSDDPAAQICARQWEKLRDVIGSQADRYAE